MNKFFVFMAISLPIVFFTSCSKDDDDHYYGDVDDGHEYVDLGLPSGILWATCNVGANKPEEYGDYFAWGETEPYYTSQNPLTWKDGKSGGYCWASYKYCNGSKTTMTKYCTNSTYGIVDNKIVLEPMDDAATANWGSNWRMPTKYEFLELLNSKNTTTEWTTMNGVNGRKITSKKNGNSIFLPAGGYREYIEIGRVGSFGYYWASTLSKRPYDCYGTERLYLNSGYINFDFYYRRSGQSIRPVRNK